MCFLLKCAIISEIHERRIRILRKEDIAEKLITYAEVNNKKLTKKDAVNYVTFVFESITKEIESGGVVKIAHFGNFYASARSEYEGKNPLTKEPIIVEGALVPRYKASKTLRDRLNNIKTSR